jgi:hypothetical protein
VDKLRVKALFAGAADAAGQLPMTAGATLPAATPTHHPFDNCLPRQHLLFFLQHQQQQQQQ